MVRNTSLRCALPPLSRKVGLYLNPLVTPRRGTLTSATTWRWSEGVLGHRASPMGLSYTGESLRSLGPTRMEANEKLALDIFGLIPRTDKRNEYILPMQDVLTKYLIFVPLKSSLRRNTYLSTGEPIMLGK